MWFPVASLSTAFNCSCPYWVRRDIIHQHPTKEHSSVIIQPKGIHSSPWRQHKQLAIFKRVRALADLCWSFYLHCIYWAHKMLNKLWTAELLQITEDYAYLITLFANAFSRSSTVPSRKFLHPVKVQEILCYHRLEGVSFVQLTPLNLYFKRIRGENKRLLFAWNL